MTNFGDVGVDRLFIQGKEIKTGETISPIKLTGEVDKDLKALAAKQNEIIAQLKIAGIIPNE